MIRKLRAEIEMIEAKIKLLQIERSELVRKVDALEWVPITWSDLKALLQEEYADKHYTKSPRVTHRPGHDNTYCFITEEGDLQVGPYFHNDRFPRGADLYIHHDKKPYN